MSSVENTTRIVANTAKHLTWNRDLGRPSDHGARIRVSGSTPRYRLPLAITRVIAAKLRETLSSVCIAVCSPSHKRRLLDPRLPAFRPLLTFGCRGRCVGSKSVSGHSQSDVSEWHVSLLMRGLSNPSAVSSTHLKPRFIRTRVLRIVY